MFPLSINPHGLVSRSGNWLLFPRQVGKRLAGKQKKWLLGVKVAAGNLEVELYHAWRWFLQNKSKDFVLFSVFLKTSLPIIVANGSTLMLVGWHKTSRCKHENLFFILNSWENVQEKKKSYFETWSLTVPQLDSVQNSSRKFLLRKHELKSDYKAVCREGNFTNLFSHL